jgi:putative acetyltransferase
MELNTRPTVTADAPGIYRLLAEVYREYDCEFDLLRDETHLLAPGPFVRARGGEFWVVEQAGEILATAAVKLHSRDTAELKTLYVSPRLRRQGWGRRLSEMVIAYARAKGCRRIVLWSDTRFLDAHRLYMSMGFRQLPETRDLHDSNNSVEYGFEREI